MPLAFFFLKISLTILGLLCFPISQSQKWQYDLIRFQGKPFNIMGIQVYALTSNAEEAEVERFYEDLYDFLKLVPKKDVLFIIGGMRK